MGPPGEARGVTGQHGTARVLRHLPWIDGLSGLVVGTVLLLAHRPLAGLFALPVPTVLGMAAANLLYATLGLSLGRMRPRSPRLLSGLVLANAAWAVVCVGLVVTYAGRASGFGLAQFVAEGLYVTVLAVLEHRHRHVILAPG